MALVKVHQEFIKDLTDYYLAPPLTRKDVLGIELPSPELPPSVPHNDFFFEILVLSLITVLVIIPLTLYLLSKFYSTSNKKFLFYLLITYILYFAYVYLVWQHSLDTDPFRVLGLNQNATFVEVRRQYRKLVKSLHPDKDNYDAEKFLQLQTAYKELSIILQSRTVVDQKLQIGLPTILENSSYYSWIVLGYFLVITLCVLGPIMILNKIAIKQYRLFICRKLQNFD